MLLSIYQVLGFCLSLIAYPLLYISKSTREQLSERYGKWKLPKGDYVWFHGASVGEVNGLVSLIAEVRVKHPEQRILGTATSSKGVQRIAEFVDEARIFPLDNYVWLSRALVGVKIKKFLYAETEIWPATLNYLNKRNTEIYMLNARLSDFKIKNYLFFKSFFCDALQKAKKIFSIDQKNANNFAKIGVKATVYGNLKYDRKLSDSTASLRGYFSNNKEVMTLACLRPGEEVYFKNILQTPDMNFILAPRHPERFDYFAKFLDNLGVEYDRKSELDSASEKKLILLDAFGELEACYAVSKYAFIGGSLVEGIGGHSPMEAAARSCNIAMGPHYENQNDCVEALLKEDAITLVGSEVEIKEFLEGKNSSGESAKKVWQNFQGLTKKLYNEIFNVA